MNPIDLDKETIELDGGWMTREQLVDTIKAQLNAGNYNVAKQAGALEQLTKTLAELRPMTIRVTAQLAEALTLAASRSGQAEATVVRHALMAYLTRGEETARPAAKSELTVRPTRPTASTARPL